MDIIRTILEAIRLILIFAVTLVGVVIGSVFDVCFMVFRTIRYWCIKGMTAIAKKINTDGDFADIWNQYLDCVWEFDMEYACRFDKLKLPSEEEEP